MKRISVLILFIYICSVPLSAQSVDKPLVTVMDFALSGISEAEGRLLVDFISNSVRETDRYRIIDRAQRDSISGRTGIFPVGGAPMRNASSRSGNSCPPT